MNIQLYDLKNKSTKVVPNYQQFKTNPRLETFAEKNWGKNHSGWINSYLSCAKKLSFSDSSLTIEADFMKYSQVAGMVKAIEEKKKFASKIIPGLAVVLVG